MATDYRNFIYDEPRGVIFAYVPKVACTNWKAVMRYLAGHADYLDNRLAHDRARGGLRYLDLSGDDRRLLNDPGIRRFACVRNPYTRTLSAYLNKVEPYLPLQAATPGQDHFAGVAQAIDRYRREVLGEERFPQIDFEVFLRWIRNRRGVRDGAGHFRTNEHWAPQTALLRWPEVRFDILGRFETLQADAAAILSAMGCDIAFPRQADVKFAPTNADARQGAYLTDRCRSLIRRLYADDFAAFGYATG